VPSTKADDGDPIDLVVVHDAATFPGIVLTCRVIGILQIEQKSKGKTERNDRLFAVPKNSHSKQALKDVSDLSKPIRQELEKFFKATDELEDKKLDIIGWKGTKAAVQASKMPLNPSRKMASDTLRRRARLLPLAPLLRAGRVVGRAPRLIRVWSFLCRAIRFQQRAERENGSLTARRRAVIGEFSCRSDTARRRREVNDFLSGPLDRCPLRLESGRDVVRMIPDDDNHRLRCLPATGRLALVATERRSGRAPIRSADLRRQQRYHQRRRGL
jgi:hypothetical protein